MSDNQKLPDKTLRELAEHLRSKISNISPTPDEETKKNKDDIERAFMEEGVRKRKLDNEQRQQQINQNENESRLREKLSSNIYWLVLGYLAVSALLVCVEHPFKIPSSVMIAFLTSVVANTIALLWCVVKYFFPEKKKNVD